MNEARELAEASPKKSWARRWLRAHRLPINEDSPVPEKLSKAEARRNRKFYKGAAVTKSAVESI